MQKEIWRDVVGYKNYYMISNLGNIKSIRIDKLLKQSISSSGYYGVSLSVNGSKKTRNIHQLVAESFLGHKPCGFKLVVNHIDFNRSNNKLNNLEVITTRENTTLTHINGSSKYVGVSWHKRDKVWQSRIIINKIRYNLGYFKNEIDAHNAYQNKLKEVNNGN